MANFALLFASLFSAQIYGTSFFKFDRVSPGLGNVFTTLIPLIFVLETGYLIGHYFGMKRIMLLGFCFVAALPSLVKFCQYTHSDIFLTIASSMQPFCLLPLIGAKELFKYHFKVKGIMLFLVGIISFLVAFEVSSYLLALVAQWHGSIIIVYGLVMGLLFQFFVPDTPRLSNKPCLADIKPQLTGLVGFLLVNSFWIHHVDNIVSESEIYALSKVCLVLDLLCFVIVLYGYPWRWRQGHVERKDRSKRAHEFGKDERATD
ncbi:hypothetical protein CA3LBN_000005 [Candidozyma haemuli]|uniref:Uncharacterized protein n=1 Tax=Candidozyma haemuli TaxID=45357 RepID=A0ABX8HYY1_9ASCO|nr:hypothetical protein CA3LBN_000005 [[Candida] haemuloni]